MKILCCHDPIPLLKDLLTTANFWEKESVLMENVAPGRLAVHQWTVSHPGVCGHHQLDMEAIYNNILKKCMKLTEWVGDGRWVWEQGGVHMFKYTACMCELLEEFL